MKIGIFGGSFNPPHNMHRDIALELIDNNYLDKVIFVPTGDSYVKNGLISFNDRYNMVKLMIRNIDLFLISDIGNNLGYQYTYQVLDYFKDIYLNDEIYFICGSDNLIEFNTWKKYQYILENYKLLVIRRNNDDIDNIVLKYYEYIDRIIITNIESNMLSSSYIRDNIDNDVSKYLDRDVYEYVRKNNLYLKKKR